MLIAAWPFPSPNGETAQVHDSSDSFPTATLALDNKGTAALGVFVARRRRKTGFAHPPREVFSRGFGATRSSLAGCLRMERLADRPKLSRSPSQPRPRCRG